MVAFGFKIWNFSCLPDHIELLVDQLARLECIFFRRSFCSVFALQAATGGDRPFRQVRSFVSNKRQIMYFVVFLVERERVLLFLFVSEFVRRARLRLAFAQRRNTEHSAFFFVLQTSRSTERGSLSADSGVG